MTMPLLSVLLPVRNGERFLKEALDSVDAQTCESLEVIVVDDGSSDSSARLAEAHRLSPRVHRQPPRGVPFALNQAMEMAEGEYVTFIDADDVWPPDRMARLLEGVRGNPEMAGAFGMIVNTDTDLRPIEKPIPARLTTTGVFRRSEMARIGPFRTDVVHATQIDWISRANAEGLRFASVAELVLLRRVHGQNMGILDRERAKRDMMIVMRDHGRRTHR